MPVIDERIPFHRDCRVLSSWIEAVSLFQMYYKGPSSDGRHICYIGVIPVVK